MNPFLFVVVGVATLLLSGCGQEEVRVYQAPKEASPSPAAAMPHPPAMGQPEAFKPEEIVYQTPADWHPLTPGPMRHALFAVSGSNGQEAQMSIMALPGTAGGEFENVNRWRGQVGLGPIKPDELKSLTETVAIGNLTGHLFDLAGPSADAKGPLRMVVAMVEKEGNSWFFKMVGADELVKNQKKVFVEFLKSIQFRDAASPPAL